MVERLDVAWRVLWFVGEERILAQASGSSEGQAEKIRLAFALTVGRISALWGLTKKCIDEVRGTQPLRRTWEVWVPSGVVGSCTDGNF